VNDEKQRAYLRKFADRALASMQKNDAMLESMIASFNTQSGKYAALQEAEGKNDKCACGHCLEAMAMSVGTDLGSGYTLTMVQIKSMSECLLCIAAFLEYDEDPMHERFSAAAEDLIKAALELAELDLKDNNAISSALNKAQNAFKRTMRKKVYELFNYIGVAIVETDDASKAPMKGVVLPSHT